MEVAVRVDVVQTQDDLLEDGRNEPSCQWSTLARLCKLVEIALHAFKDKVQLFR